MSTSISKSKVLLISHCLPEPCGNSHSARAWQLLQLASASHDVDLACAVQGSVNLQQWRTAASTTARLHMDTANIRHRAISSLTSLVNEPAASQKRWLASLTQGVNTWANQYSYDAVICTHPALWTLARTVNASKHICDMDSTTVFATPASQHDTGNRAFTFSNLSMQTWFDKMERCHYETLHQQVASECDVLTTSHLPRRDTLSAVANDVLHLPRAVDLSWFNTASANDMMFDATASPTLMLHANENRRAGKATWEWFAHHVWRKVKQAVPNAQWSKPSVAMGSSLDSIRNASVIVSPLVDPGQGQWAALQSMAMRRPVIASAAAVAELGVRHGEHLLMSCKPADWVELCVESLRSASVRLKLAQAGRAFVESHYSHHPMAAAGNLFSATRQTHPAAPDRLAATLSASPLAMAA